MLLVQDSIDIWAGRPKGKDPTIHFWFERDDGIPYRICDGAVWREHPKADDDPVPFTPCRLCKEVYLADVLHGRKVLTIAPEPPASVEAHTLYNGMDNPKTVVYTPLNGVSYPKNGVSEMPRVPMSMFAKFYEVRPAKQVSIVREIRARLNAPDLYMSRDYYGPLRQVIRQTHWATRNIATFEDALPPLLDVQTRKRDHYRDIGQSYIAFWINKDATYFPVTPVDVAIGDLTINVNPEGGMRSDGDDQVLKLWFNVVRPSRQTRQVIVHLMNLAKAQSNEWQPRWHPGILDIRRRNVPLPVGQARDFELGLSGQAAAFMRIWEDLEQGAREMDMGG